ncbi:hypothetical protein [Marinobacter sp. DSM 26671]|uniref:hypothetical protein n=1 Tax=Marinobacter sp. DSM 26671 TaxID=1761793 RepID=UPI000B868845|nr:hypothetical protein [Marinobacter sp. DSM 26671]
MAIDHQESISINEIHKEIVTRGLGKKGTLVVPYPSAEYVRHNNLEKSENLGYENVSRLFDRKPSLKPDKTWELIAQWRIDGLKITGFDPDKPNPLSEATVNRGDLAKFLKENEYAIPAGLVNELGLSGAATPIMDPDSTYMSAGLRAVVQASVEFWKTADRDDSSTHPTSTEVVEYLTDNPVHNIPRSYAEKYATLIRPAWAAKGRRAKST